jgi:lipopolysaccharide transport system permease protein
MALGAAWLIAAVGVFVRDVRHVMQFVIQILLYGSAIFYSQANVPERFWNILQINPLVHAVEMSRGIVLWGEHPGIVSTLYLWFSALLAVWVGWSSFRVLRPTFADAL